MSHSGKAPASTLSARSAFTRPWALNAAPSAPSRSSQPAPRTMRDGTPDWWTKRTNDRRDEADQRRACEQAQSCQLAIDGLAAQFEAERFLRAPLLLFHLRALELEPRVVAIECFLERRDDDIGQPRFDLTGNSLRRRRWRQRRFRRRRLGGKTLEPARGIAKCDDGIVGLEESAEIHLMPAFKTCSRRATSATRRETVAACRSIPVRPAQRERPPTVDRRSPASST